MKRLALAALLLPLGACQVSTDEKNESVAVSYDENTAEATGDAIASAADNLADDIKQDVSEEGARLGEVVDNVQVDDHAGDAGANDKATAANSH